MVVSVVTLSSGLSAQDYGDAPASYGLPIASGSLPEKLGATWTGDTTNPVSPAWTGDSDDGLVGTPATWTPGLSNNSVTVSVVCGTYTQYLALFIDMNDDGDFLDANERINHPSFPTAIDGNYTFSNIALPFINYTRNGLNKIAVRFMLRYNSAIIGPSDSFSYGEVEDYLLDVYPAGLGIVTPSPLPNAAEGSPYNTEIEAMFGTTPYNWNTAISGLPPGITASIVNNKLVLSGTPTTGSAATYNFNVSLTDSANPVASANSNYTIAVVPPPYPAPFLDDFSTDKVWLMGSTWTRGVATAYNPTTTPTRSEPGVDATPAPNNDNMILGDTIGGDYSGSIAATLWATSPRINCTSLTNVRLRFQRWLGVNIGAQAFIQVSNNGNTWNTVWSHNAGTSSQTLRDTAWTLVSYDLTTHAAGMATVQVRFGIGPSTGSTSIHTGWCIDDFQVFDPGPDLEVKEGGTTGTTITDNLAVGGLRNFGTVTMGQQSTALVIGLINNSSSSITFGSPFPKSGTNPGDFYIDASSMPNPLPAGQSTTFTITFFVATTGTAGVKSATISIPHNAGGVTGQSFEINVAATADPPGTGTIEVYIGSTAGTQVTHQQAAASTARDFGQMIVNTGPGTPITLVISNPGPGTLTITQPDMGGTWWTNYVVGTVSSLSIAQGSTATFTVAFNPDSVGIKNAFVRIPNTQQGGPAVFEVPVVGEGIPSAPLIDVYETTVGGNPIAHNDPAASTARDFGSQGVTAGPTAALTIVIENTGGADMTLGMPTLTGTGAAHFVLDTTGYLTTVPAGSSTSFTVAFDPTTNGQHDAVINITHNDTTTPSPFLIPVTGLGVTTAPAISVRETSSTGTTLANPAPAAGILAFGNQAIGTTSAAAVIYVENTGTANLNLTTPNFTTGTTEFTINATGFAGPLAPGANRTFSITFNPTTTGNKASVISFTHNGAGTSSPFQLNVSGNGINNAPYLEVRVDSLAGPMVAHNAAALSGGDRDLGSVDIAAGTLTKTVFVANPGTQDLTVSAPSLLGPDAAQYAVTTTGFPATLTAGSNISFTITFDPTNVGVKAAYIELVHNDASQTSPFIINVVGTGTSPTGVVIDTSSLPSGVVGQPYGPVTLTALQGTAPYTWSLHNSTLPSGLTLSPTGNITGTPTSGGNFNVRIRVTDDTGGTNDRVFMLQLGGGALSTGGRAGGGGGCVAAAPVMPFAMIALLALPLLRRRRK